MINDIVDATTNKQDITATTWKNKKHFQFEYNSIIIFESQLIMNQN